MNTPEDFTIAQDGTPVPVESGEIVNAPTQIDAPVVIEPIDSRENGG